MIIALSGYAGAGKDLVGKMLQYYSSPCSAPKMSNYKHRTFDQFIERGGGSQLRDFDHHYYTDWEIKKFAGKLKEVASMLTGIPVQMFEDQEFKKRALGRDWCYPTQWQGREHWVEMTVREFMQKLGTDGLRENLHPNVWVNALFADYIPVHTDHVPGGFEYPNWIITDCRFENEAQAVKARGGVVVRINRPGVEAVNAHPSETALDNWNFDYTINNDGDINKLLERVAVLYETLMVTQQ